MTDPSEVLGLPYSTTKTRQVLGSKAEKRMAKDRGARLHPMSGAGSIKDDASNDTFIYEFKNALRSHTLKSGALWSLWRRALRAQKEARYVIYFEEDDITATIIIEKGRGTEQ